MSRADGYKIQPLIPLAGGTGGEVFYLQNEQELKAFANRPDVNLDIFVVGVTTASARENLDTRLGTLT